MQPWRRKEGGYTTNIGEREFLSRVQSSDGFWKSLNGLSKVTGMEVDALEGFARDICRSMWPEVDAVMSSEGPIAAAREEVDRLKKKITECNLSAMKQMLAAKSAKHLNGELGDDTICFHEPLQYLDKDSKDLVMNVVCDKVRQLESGTAPPSLVQALVQHAEAQQSPQESASMEELKEAHAQLEDARVELRKARVRMEEAEELSRKFEIRLRAAEDRAQMFEQELNQTKDVLASTEEKLAATEEKLAETERTLAGLRVEHEKLQSLCDEQQAKIEQQERELKYERQAKEKLQKEVERLQQYMKRAEQLEGELKALQAKHQELEAEASAMREELARRNNTRTAGTQTSLTGPKLDEKAAETRKLKLMLEELQTKLKELMTEYRRKFGDAATKIADSLGLKELLKEETVFQRLYDDAMERVHRLEKLRARVKKERQGIWPTPGSPRSLATGEAPEMSVLQAVEENQPTPGMQQLVQEKIVEMHNVSTSWASPPKWQDQGCGDEMLGEDVWQRLQKISQPVMKGSTSLPSLTKPEQHVSMLTLNLDRGRKGLKRREFF